MRGSPGPVVVLGGGPSGLAAAHELSAGGVQVVVLEGAPWVGGLSMTREYQGFRSDLGGHRWFTKTSWLHEWFVELMKGELVSVNRISRIRFGGRYIDYPIKLGNVLRSTGLLTSAHALASYAGYKLVLQFRQQPIENIEQAYITQFGSKLYEMFFKQYTEKVWGRKCTELSADWVGQRTKGLSAWQTIRDAVGKSGEKAETLIDSFLYPRLGYQRISERMKEDIEKRGGLVALNSKVTAVTISGDGVAVRYRGRNGSSHEVEGSHVISTIPLGDLADILTPRAPSTVLEAAKGLEFRSVVSAVILIDKEQVTRDTWLYIHESNVGFARIHEPRNWSEAMAPPGRTSLCTEWFCTYGDAVWKTSDEEIIERTIEHLSDDLELIERDEVIGGFTIRARHAYPVYTLDYAERVDAIKEYLETHADHISIAGRGGTFRYNNADHSIETGLLVAKNLLGEDHDVEAVNTEAEYHEANVVGS